MSTTPGISNEYLPMRVVASSAMAVLVAVTATLAVTALSGCIQPNPASCADNDCGDPALPFCDVDGAIAGHADTCIAVSCTAGEFRACREDRALVCNATGDNYDVLECEFGCSPAAGCNTCNTSDCEKHIIPKYLPTVCGQLASSASLTIAADTTLDTSEASACTSIVPQASGPEICVTHFGTITIERSRTYTVTGSRALALVADYALVVDGILDVSASGASSGPGGGFVWSGWGMGVPGGGAGYRTAGGSGTTGNTTGGAANGGPMTSHPAALADLLGGNRPSTGAGTATPGGGGGAATLISCRATTSVAGVIDAAGGGGEGGYIQMTKTLHPAGGGSGGTLVLQGAQVTVTGEVYANGGGGGGGVPSHTSGSDGLQSTEQAPGGSGVITVSFAGEGGAGGALAAARDGSRCPPDGGACGGAGGGSAGYILIYIPQANGTIVDPMTASPEIDAARVIATN